jgi:hypothetical protein
MNQIPVLRERGMREHEDMLQARMNACDALPETTRIMCVEGAGWSSFTIGSLERTARMCNERESEPERVACVFGASGSYIEFGGETETVIGWCQGFEHAVRNACYIGVFDALTYRRDPALANACEHAQPSCAETLADYLAHPEVPVPR